MASVTMQCLMQDSTDEKALLKVKTMCVKREHPHSHDARRHRLAPMVKIVNLCASSKQVYSQKDLIIYKLPTNIQYLNVDMKLLCFIGNNRRSSKL